MKRTLIASAVSAALIAYPAWAVPDASETSNSVMPMQIAQATTPQTPQGPGPGMMGQGMGPGMRGQGYGPGMTGQGYGPGMMGQGYGPGMMGQGYGPGMMGQGYGPGMMGQGYGPGMMGQGMGPGMVGPGMMGHGCPTGMMGGMMGRGMMYGINPYGALNLSAEQRAKIADIREGLWRKRWDLMGKMHEQRYYMRRLMGGAVADEASARKAYQAVAEARKQMFEAMLEARKQIDSVLTKEQREQLRGG
jgi:protein CpxP